MTALERRTVAALAGLYAFRMLGLFMALPLLSLYGTALAGGNAFTLGLALGAYGLAQAALQMPLGLLSDRIGRVPVIVAGLLVFAAGSLLAAGAETVEELIAGRFLQGAGAIASTVLALVADLTSDKQRTKAMALVGMSIGLSFALALVLGPALAAWGGLAAVFNITAALALMGVLMVLFAVPRPSAVGAAGIGAAGTAAAGAADVLGTQVAGAAGAADVPGVQVAGAAGTGAAGAEGAAAGAPRARATGEATTVPALLAGSLRNAALLRLNLGVFILHFVLMAVFVSLPGVLEQQLGLGRAEHWKLYLPALALSLGGMVPLMILAERKGRLRGAFLLAVLALMLTQGPLHGLGGGWLAQHGLGGGWLVYPALWLFFAGFNYLEASLPSLVSKTVPASGRGTALGVYSSFQFLGAFAGGAAGGWLHLHWGAAGVAQCAAALAALWWLVCLWLRPPAPSSP